MKKCLLLLLALNLLAPMPIRASYVVISSDGSVIEEKDSHDVQSVASISKIMTALVVLEHSELNEIVTISYLFKGRAAGDLDYIAAWLDA